MGKGAKMKTYLVLILSLWVSWAVPTFAQSPTTEEETLDVPKARRFIYLTIGIEYDEKLNGTPDVIAFKGDFKKVTTAAYKKDISAIHFIPKKEGVATLTVHDKSGKKLSEFRLIVRKSNLDAVARELQSLLGEVEGITVRIVNNRVVVDGQVLLPSDMARIVTVVSQFPEKATAIVTMSPLAMKKIAELIARDINNPEIEVAALNERIVLKGQADSSEIAKNYEAIAKSYMPPLVLDYKEAADKIQRRKPANDGVVNLIQIKAQPAAPLPKMIQVVVHYVELSKNYQKSFRFQFTPEINDGGSGIPITAGDTGNGFGTQITATINNLFPKLNWAKQHGHARVLESGSIMVKDGSQAVFESKTTIGQQTVSQNGTAVSGGGQQVGITVKVTPTTTGERSDSVDLNLDFRVGAPAGTGPNGQLNVAQNIITTSLIVRSTQSAAVGGLITNQSTTGYNKTPPGVSNPIISLLASKDFSHDQSQFVVFVTPIVRSSASTGAEKIKQKFRIRD